MWPSGLRQQVANLSCCANTQHREFESHRLRQVIKWAVGIVGNTVALQASVIGSIPIRSTIKVNAGVAQLVEHRTCNAGVASSNPAAGTR